MNKFSIKGRMYIIIGTILVLFLMMACFVVITSGYVRDIGIEKTGAVMLVSAFAKLKKQGFVPNRDIIIMLTADEETAGNSSIATSIPSIAASIFCCCPPRPG